MQLSLYNQQIFDTKLGQHNIPLNIKNDFIDYNYNFGSLDQEYIDKRSTIYAFFIAHQESFLKCIFQNGKYDSSSESFEYISHFSNYKFIFKLNTKDIANNAFCQIYINDIYLDSIDILMVIARIRNIDYKECINFLYESLKNNNLFAKDTTKNNPEWHIQEKYPVAIDTDHWLIENIFKAIENENQAYNPRIYHYYNKHNINIGRVLVYTNKYGKEVRIYYTFYRRYNSARLKLVPIYPEKPYMFFCSRKVGYQGNKYVIAPSETEAIEYHSFEYIPLAAPFGSQSIPDCNISDLKDIPIYIELAMGKYKEGYLHNLKEKFKKMDLGFYIYCKTEKEKYNFYRIFWKREYDRINENIILKYLYSSESNAESEHNYNKMAHLLKINSIDDLLNADEFVIREPLTISSKNNFANPGEKIPGSERKRKIILDPIIKSGTLNWFYAKEKVGKSWLALTIAYACSKGHRPVGQWKSVEPCSVLYLDGELPGDIINDRCDKIMKGFDDESGYKNRPFSVYSFFEEDKDYTTIMDECWQKEYNNYLLSFDLIIFDSYFSLNNNEVNVRPFLKYLRKFQKRDIAIIVIDHENSEGELQGSIAKRRAADYGLCLSSIEEGCIDIKNQFDRHDVSVDSPDHVIKFIFSDYSFEITKKQINKQKDNITKDERIYAICYVLSKRGLDNLDNMHKSLGIAKSTISMRNTKLQSFIDGNEETFDNIRANIVKKEIERLFKLPDIDIQNEFNDIKNSLKK